ncbi:hypothetical protein E1B25_21230 [Antarcticimicrobium sediminis]|uniref:Uncharacterized protein n=1 Tax=Antarcticimicrobium sediminis TaxID=2546227 RepID=A0A4R5EGJ0_9RHOB|nr:hypothetical protein E1B25_21230 [Antarcticimicrobium sediminis]
MSGGRSDLFWLSDAQMTRLDPYFPKTHGKPCVRCPAGDCAAICREGCQSACNPDPLSAPKNDPFILRRGSWPDAV